MSGYGAYSVDPDSVSEKKCGVCGTICDVRRGVHGATSFGEAMSHKGHLHDAFRCPHIRELWHKQAVKIMQEIEKCPSPSIRKIMNDDLSTILQKREENEDR